MRFEKPEGSFVRPKPKGLEHLDEARVSNLVIRYQARRAREEAERLSPPRINPEMRSRLAGLLRELGVNL